MRIAIVDQTEYLFLRIRFCISEVSKWLTRVVKEPQIKKHLTAEEHAMRRAEMARRRKNLSEKRNEEEKVRFISQTLPKFSPWPVLPLLCSPPTLLRIL